MIECWESELDPLGSVSVVGQFVTVGLTRMTGSVRVVSVRVVSVTDAMKRFLSVGACPTGESENGGRVRPRDRLLKV